MSGLSPQGRALFLDLVDLPRAERDAELARRCAGEPALAAEVAALLAADDDAEGFLEPPELGLGRDDELVGRWLEGRRIGSYTLGRRIGIGGMGTVYVAEQDRPRRKVALKLLRTGLGTGDVRRRFAREVEILGRLSHPGIAEIYEAGTHESELGPIPYFALEYIPEACPITRHAERLRLERRARVELFASVCDAVAHAHAHGVIHRDLKPSNILVGSDGRPRLIDFGVARWIDEAGLGATIGTRDGDLLGTLHYMSPEQFEGHAPGAASDVYALGVVLYELVAGELPYPVAHAAAGRIAELVRTHEPAPATRGGPRWRELDAVVAMALAKSPAHRYPSAAELASDLRRLLGGEPVRASRSQRAHRARVLLARGRRALPWIGAASAAAMALVLARPPTVPQAAASDPPSPSAAVDADATQYLHRIAVAERALAAGDFAQAKASLAACAPAQRGWEWRRLSTMVDQSVFTLPLGTNANTLAYDRSRELLVATSGVGVLLGIAVEGGVSPRATLRWRRELGGEVGPLRIDPEAGIAYVGGDDGRVTLYRLDDGEATGSFGEGSGVWGLALTEDRTHLVLSRRAGVVERWSLATRERIDVIEHDATFGELALRGEIAYVAMAPAGVAVVDLAAGRVRGEMPGHEGVEAVIATDDRVYATGWDSRIAEYDRDSFAQLRAFPRERDGMVDLLALDAVSLVSAGRDGTIVVWDVPRGRSRLALRGHDFGVEALATFADDRWLASVGLDATLRLWDPHSPPTEVELASPEKIHAVAYTADGRGLLVASGPQWGDADLDGVTLWSAADGGMIVRALDHGSTVDALAVGDGVVASGARDGEVVVRDAGLQPRLRIAAHRDAVHGLAFAPDGTTLASGSHDGAIALWTIDDGRSLARIDAGVGAIADLAWTPAGLVAVGADGVVRIDGTHVARIAATTDARAVAITSDGGVVVGDGEGTLARIAIADGTVQWSVPTFGRAITDVAVSPDGTRVAASNQDYRIRLHDAASGTHVLTIGAHSTVATAVAFAPDGNAVASGGYDRRARIWRAR